MPEEFHAMETVIIIGGLIFAVSIWLMAISLLAKASKWKVLAEKHPVTRVPDKLSLVTGILNGIRYGYCLSVGLDGNGLYISILPIFYPFKCNAAQIPWSEISEITYDRGFLLVYSDVKLKRHYGLPSIRLYLKIDKKWLQNPGLASP
jgi:hypothetical protein